MYISNETMAILVSIMETYGVPKDVMAKLHKQILTEKSQSTKAEHARIKRELDTLCMDVNGWSIDLDLHIHSAKDINNGVVECMKLSNEKIKAELTRLDLNSWF